MSFLSTLPKEKLKAMLTQAQDAYHQIITGTKAVKVSRAGRAVEYNSANKNELLAYIQELQDAINNNVTGRRAAKVWF